MRYKCATRLQAGYLQTCKTQACIFFQANKDILIQTDVCIPLLLAAAIRWSCLIFVSTKTNCPINRVLLSFVAVRGLRTARIHCSDSQHQRHVTRHVALLCRVLISSDNSRLSLFAARGRTAGWTTLIP
jgi:hypothetical protein